ncbi:MAG: phosphatidylserine decarboxylase family protein [Candidatus Muiribacteriota bacterium]
MRKIGFIAKEGYKFFVIFALISAIIISLKFIFETTSIFNICIYITGGIFAFLAFFSLLFFRNPKRILIPDNSKVICPADGKVVLIEEVKDEWTGEKSKKVSVFMSVFNVHINRISLSGKINKVTYTPGIFLNAADTRASFENERNRVEIEGDFKIAVIQIAGLIARRIKCFVKDGDNVTQGDYLGLIQFGSRLDIIVPEEIEIKVQKGQLVKAGVDIIGIKSR